MPRHYILVLLCLVGVFNYVDRQIITVLLEPIKREFEVSDSMMGLLSGTVFAAFYALASLPIARLADVGNRRKVIAVSLGFWSAMTVLGGLATGFWALAATRVGVAIGEAGATPASHSMLADLYPLKQRATVIAILAGVSTIGIGLGVFLGGWLADAHGWRSALFAVGVPGVLLAMLVGLTVKEPVRGEIGADAAPGTLSVLRHLWRLKSYRLIVLTVACGAATGYGMLGWAPTFLMRVHGLSSTEVGISYGALSAAALLFGGLISGILADWAGRYGIKGYMWVAGAGPLVAVPFGLLFAFTSDTRVALGSFFVMLMMLMFHNPPSFAMGQTLAPPRMRAVASVVMNLFLIGAGIGLAPLLIGISNDLLSPRLGDTAIRYSLAASLVGAVGAAAAAFLSTMWLKTDHAHATREAQAAAGPL